jgi:hypothetical protein
LVILPVLSEQILVTPPIISQEDSYFTRLFSSFILLTEYAKAIVTANGSPSGTATTTIVTATKKLFIISFKLSMQRKQCYPNIILIIKCINIAHMVNAAAIVPTFPISSATVSSFFYKGVGGCSSCSFSFNFPNYVYEPTVHTKIKPLPSITFNLLFFFFF